VHVGEVPAARLSGVRPPLKFKDDDTFQPPKAWAERFVREAPAYYLEMLADYRQRVGEYHAEAANLYPEKFPWLNGTDLLVVCVLTGCWVFARESDSGEDRVEFVERWEDPVLASPDAWTAPSHEEFIVRHIDVDLAGWTRVADYDVRSVNLIASWGPFENRRHPGHFVEGWDLADRDETGRQLEMALNELAGPSVDRLAVRAVASAFEELEAVGDRQRRGLAFEDWLMALLEAHGCDAEKGKHIPGEQSDIFVHRPFRALIEARWRAQPAGVEAVTGIVAKLRRERPAMVIGVFVSMSGYTEQAHAEAKRCAADRVVLLLNRQDVYELTTGELHIADLVKRRLDAVVRRY